MKYIRNEKGVLLILNKFERYFNPVFVNRQ